MFKKNIEALKTKNITLAEKLCNISLEEAKENIEVFSEQLDSAINMQKEQPNNKKLENQSNVLGTLLDEEIAKKERLVALEKELDKRIKLNLERKC